MRPRKAVGMVTNCEVLDHVKSMISKIAWDCADPVMEKRSEEPKSPGREIRKRRIEEEVKVVLKKPSSADRMGNVQSRSRLVSGLSLKKDEHTDAEATLT